MDELFAKEADVTGEDRQALGDAIRCAYPDFAFLYLRLANKWGMRVDDYTDVRRGRLVIVADIIDLVDSQGRLLDLLAVTWSDRPGNPKLKALVERFLLDEEAIGAKYAPVPAQPRATDDAPGRPPLQKLVEKRSRLLDMTTFQQGMARLSGALCRISTAEARGTGFLVGRRSVLTNFHVLKEAIMDGLDGGQITCQFDYHGEGQPGVDHKAAAGIAWKGPHSPYSPSDLSSSGEPAPDELDFVLLTLASDVEATRAPLVWPIAPPIVSQRDFVVIGQHPGGKASNVAFGEVLAYPASGLRYRYDVTTEPGSSGSPVLSMDLDLIALHHAGDPDLAPKYNQGVPIWRIMTALREANLDLAAL